jgi:hypothetical protein
MKKNLKKNPKDIPYVLVQHNESGKAFALSRGYRLMSANVPTPVKLWMINNQVQKDAGWFPTNANQSPRWAREFVAEDFTAYWIDYNKHYQQLVANS